MIDPRDLEKLKAQTDLVALIGAYTPLKWKARTNGGEWAGPCPWCGGSDRFLVWPQAERPGYHCRQCGKNGDAISFLMDREQLSFAEACKRLGAEPMTTLPRRKPAPPTEKAEPTEVWGRRAADLVNRCEANLWGEDGARARAWLERRGLTEETLKHWRVGFNPEDRYEDPIVWGLPDRDHKVWIPKGITLPWIIGGKLCHVKIRRATGSPKFMSVTGGCPTLYGADTLKGRDVSLLAEGEFDCLFLWQEAGDLVGTATL